MRHSSSSHPFSFSLGHIARLFSQPPLLLHVTMWLNLTNGVPRMWCSHFQFGFINALLFLFLPLSAGCFPSNTETYMWKMAGPLHLVSLNGCVEDSPLQLIGFQINYVMCITTEIWNWHVTTLRITFGNSPCYFSILINSAIILELFGFNAKKYTSIIVLGLYHETAW